MKNYKKMPGRIVALFLAAIMAIGFINWNPFMASGMEKQETVVDMGSYHMEDNTGLDNDELFENYLNQIFYGKQETSLYSSDYGISSGKLDEKEKKLYLELKKILTEIANGEKQSSQFDIDVSGMGFTEDNLGTSITEILDMLLADCPFELYWYNKTALFKYIYSHQSDGSVTSIKFIFPVDMNYGDPKANTVSNTGVTRAKAAKEKADQIVGKYKDKSDYEKLKAYMQEICKLNTYNDEAAKSEHANMGIDPWQLVYVFDGDSNTNVVCEGYAKAFAYLFERSTFRYAIKCYIVTGLLGVDGHMWNIVTMEDGKNYMVDVTNCDGDAIGNPDKLFLAGLPGNVSKGYTYTRDSDNTAVFTYNDDTKNMYPDSILSLADKNYDPGTATPVLPLATPKPSQEPSVSSAPSTPSTIVPSSKPFDDLVTPGCSHIFKDYGYTEPVSGSAATALIYANGSKKTDESTGKKTDNRQFTAYTDIMASYKYSTNDKGVVKTAIGKVIVAVTMKNEIPVVNYDKNKIEKDNIDSKAAKIAKAKIKNGQVTVTATGKAKGDGVIYLWVIDTGCKRVYESCPVNVKMAPKKMEVRESSNAAEKIKKKPEVKAGGTCSVYVAGLDPDSNITKDCSYTYEIAENSKNYIEVTPSVSTDGNFTIKAAGLNGTKKTNAAVTFKCVENGKKVKFTITIIP